MNLFFFRKVFKKSLNTIMKIGGVFFYFFFKLYDKKAKCSILQNWSKYNTQFFIISRSKLFINPLKKSEHIDFFQSLQ